MFILEAFSLFSGILIFFFITKCVLIISEGHVVIIERLGKYNRILQPGIHFLNPITESPKCVKWEHESEELDKIVKKTKTDYLLSSKETIFDPPAIQVISKDRITLHINVVVFYKIINFYNAVYLIEDMHKGLEQLVYTSIRESASNLDLDQIIREKDALAKAITKKTDSTNDKWGIEVNRVEIQSITTPQSIMKATENLVAETRKSEAQMHSNKVARESQLFSMDTEMQLNKLKAKKALEEKELQQQHLLSMQKIESTINEEKHQNLLKVQQIEFEKKKLEAESEAHRLKVLLSTGVTQEFMESTFFQ
jgi:regulator of protease activity HflC (stomatin/prohibitin superfamily)